MKFELYRSFYLPHLRREWRWRLIAANGETLASGESYKNRSDAVHAITLVQASSTAKTVEL